MNPIIYSSSIFLEFPNSDSLAPVCPWACGTGVSGSSTGLGGGTGLRHEQCRTNANMPHSLLHMLSVATYDNMSQPKRIEEDAVDAHKFLDSKDWKSRVNKVAWQSVVGSSDLFLKICFIPSYQGVSWVRNTSGSAGSSWIEAPVHQTCKYLDNTSQDLPSFSMPCLWVWVWWDLFLRMLFLLFCFFLLGLLFLFFLAFLLFKQWSKQLRELPCIRVLWVWAPQSSSLVHSNPIASWQSREKQGNNILIVPAMKDSFCAALCTTRDITGIPSALHLLCHLGRAW